MSSNAVLKLARPWDQVKEKIQENEISLTDKDLEYVPGQEDQLLDRLAKKLNKTPDAVKGWIESISENSAQAG